MQENELKQIEREFETLADGHPEYSYKLVIGDKFGQEWSFFKAARQADVSDCQCSRRGG